jgi:hypothetical protein
MSRYALIALIGLAFVATGCKTSVTTDTKADEAKKDKDKKKADDDDDDDDDDEPKKKKKAKSGDDDDDDDDEPKKKKAKSGDDDDDDDDEGSLLNTGVKECDEYLKLYQKCIVDKAAPEAKKSMQEGLKTQADAFKKSAKVPAAKAALAQSCEGLIEGTKKECKK